MISVYKGKPQVSQHTQRHGRRPTMGDMWLTIVEMLIHLSLIKSKDSGKS